MTTEKRSPQGAVGFSDNDANPSCKALLDFGLINSVINISAGGVCIFRTEAIEDPVPTTYFVFGVTDFALRWVLGCELFSTLGLFELLLSLDLASFLPTAVVFGTVSSGQ